MNNENSNNGLNSISLGSVDNIGSTPNGPIDPNGIETLNTPVAPAEPIAPIQPLNEVNTPNNGIIGGSVVNPVPPVEPVNQNNDVINNINNVPPVAPLPPLEPVTPIYDVSETINSFNSAPVFNDIGTVPPINNIPIPDTPIAETPKDNTGGNKKGGISKLLFVIIIVLALTAVGVGVYIFLGMSNNVTSGVKVKQVKIDVGSAISTNIEDFATFSGINSNTCELDTTKIISTENLGSEYPFTIKCNDKTYQGTATIVDSTPPVVNLTDVTIGVNEEVTPDQFIESCTDKTKCSYAFKNPDEVKGYTAIAGTYKVAIIVKDEGENEAEFEANLTVDDAVATLYLVCSKSGDTYVEVTKLGLADSTFVKKAIRNYEFTLNETNYTAFKNDNADKTEVEYNGIKGTYTLDDANKKVTISKKLTYEELTEEAGSEIPLGFGELRTFYTSKGYSCAIGS
ncbi:MAG: hypothetical protein NC483_07265 [Ruminococcus sp.]|nr:hypothetical protein [Ruminococcus sp.]